jgi:hypothetical protein
MPIRLSRRGLWREWIAGGAMAVVLAMRVASPTTANLSFLALAVYALGGRSQAVQALGVSWLLTMVNPGIAAEAALAPMGRYAVIAAAAVSVWLRSVKRGPVLLGRAVAATALLGVAFACHSLVLSASPDVSLLKAASWTIATVTLLSAWDNISDEEHARLGRQVFSGLAMVALLSVPLLAVESGYLRNGSGFQGILNHPQAFGSSMAMLGSWLVAGVLAETKPSWKRAGALAAAAVLIVLSEARTAGLALVGGVLVAVVATALTSKRTLRQVMPGLWSARVRVWAVFLGAAALLAAPFLTERLLIFLQKRGQTGSIVEAYDASRGVIVRRMLDNIERTPMRGIGFGIPSDPSAMLVVERDQWSGVPVGAAIEKGVLPLAVVEEVGIPGALAVGAWLTLLLRRAMRRGLVPAAVIFAALFTNLGESTLFSPGAMGLLMLLLASWACTGRASPNASRTPVSLAPRSGCAAPGDPAYR